MIIEDEKTGKSKDVRLPKTFKSKWIKALRSEKYNQSNGRLHNKNINGWCCLGVACDIVHPNLQYDSRGYISGDLLDKVSKVPKVLKGSASENDVVKNLSAMNDRGRSFKYIAKWIERYL